MNGNSSMERTVAFMSGEIVRLEEQRLRDDERMRWSSITIRSQQNDINRLETANGALRDDLLHTQEVYETLFKQASELMKLIDRSAITTVDTFQDYHIAFQAARQRLAQTLEGGSSHEPVGKVGCDSQAQPADPGTPERRIDIRAA